MMANKTEQTEGTEVVRAMTPIELEALTEQQRRQSIEEARFLHSDVTRPGGLYVVNGQAVDANGEPITGRSLAELEAEIAATRAALPPKPF